MRRRQRCTVPPHPIFAFLGGERVNVDEHVPVWRIAAKTLERRRAPYASGIGGILPRVEQSSSAAVGKGNIIWAIKDSLEDLAVGGHAFIEKTSQRCRVLCFDPVEHARVLDLFEPEVGVIIWRFECRARIKCRHEGLRERRKKSMSVSFNGMTAAPRTSNRQRRRRFVGRGMTSSGLRKGMRAI